MTLEFFIYFCAIIFYVYIFTSEAEQAAQQLVNGRGQAVDIVTVTLQLGLEQGLGYILSLLLMHLVFSAF